MGIFLDTCPNTNSEPYIYFKEQTQNHGILFMIIYLIKTSLGTNPYVGTCLYKIHSLHKIKT